VKTYLSVLKTLWKSSPESSTSRGRRHDGRTAGRDRRRDEDTGQIRVSIAYGKRDRLRRSERCRDRNERQQKNYFDDVLRVRTHERYDTINQRRRRRRRRRRLNTDRETRASDRLLPLRPRAKIIPAFASAAVRTSTVRSTTSWVPPASLCLHADTVSYARRTHVQTSGTRGNRRRSRDILACGPTTRSFACVYTVRNHARKPSAFRSKRSTNKHPFARRRRPRHVHRTTLGRSSVVDNERSLNP